MSYIGRDVNNISNVEKLDNITFDGGTTYALTKSSVAYTPSGANNILISIDGIVQQGNFSVSTTNIVFDWSPTSSNTCDWILHIGVGVLNIPADSSVTASKLGSLAVTGAKLNTDVISAQTALAVAPADTDEFMVSDGGVLKRIDYSLIKGGGTHVKLLSGSASSAVNQDFQSFMDTSKYNTYMVEFSNLVGLQGNTFDFQFLQSDNSVSGAGYWGSVQGMRSSGNAYADNYENVAQGELGSALDTSASTVGAYLFWIYNNPNSTTYGSSVYGHNWGYRADWSDFIFADFTIGFNNSNSVHGFRVHAAGNDATTFNYAIYGIAK